MWIGPGRSRAEIDDIRSVRLKRLHVAQYGDELGVVDGPLFEKNHADEFVLAFSAKAALPAEGFADAAAFAEAFPNRYLAEKFTVGHWSPPFCESYSLQRRRFTDFQQLNGRIYSS